MSTETRWGTGSKNFHLPLGPHKVVVANYGYKFFEREVSMGLAGKPIVRELPTVASEESAVWPDSIGIGAAEPRGRRRPRGSDRTGKRPTTSVVIEPGNQQRISGRHQELIVPAGSHIVTVTRRGKQVVDTVSVAANQRVIIDIRPNGKRKTKDWAAGRNSRLCRASRRA